MTPVYLECGPKRTFAVAVEWPGWARSGRTEAAALEALAAYAPRYALAVGADPPTEFEVVERLPGGPITDFGALTVACSADRRGVSGPERERWAEVLRACWGAFDDAVAAAPGELRKGPRGGGRNTSAVVDHVRETDRLNATGFGTPFRKYGDPIEVREGIVQALLAAEGPFETTRRYGFQWTPLFAARRCAWHVLDHAWEVEDRSG